MESQTMQNGELKARINETISKLEKIRIMLYQNFTGYGSSVATQDRVGILYVNDKLKRLSKFAENGEGKDKPEDLKVKIETKKAELQKKADELEGLKARLALAEGTGVEVTDEVEQLLNEPVYTLKPTHKANRGVEIPHKVIEAVKAVVGAEA